MSQQVVPNVKRGSMLLPSLPPSLRLDRRLGGIERWIFASDTEAMQIPNEMRKCVVFVGLKRKSGMAVNGTAFFVGYEIEGTDSFATYAVTAKHVIDEIKTHSIDHLSYFRLNNREHGAVFAPIDLNQWIVNDDDRIDVAVAPVSIDFQVLDHLLVPVKTFVSDEIIATHEIGVGEELFFPGLFTHHKGEKANIPIVRMGNIAAMPEERINTRIGNLRAYLAEARSIGGLSGSPAFVSTTGMRKQQGQNVIIMGGAQYFLIGLVHGHYGVRDVLDSCDDILSDTAQSRSVNMGIAIIVPADDVLSTLNHQSLIAQREAIKSEIEAKNRASLPEMD